MRALVVVALVGCASTTAPSPPLANHAAAPNATQVLRPLIVDGYEPCVPHHVTISVDEVPTVVVAVTCPPIPPKNAVVVTDGQAHTIDGPPIRIAAGRHTISVRDDESGRTAIATASFPAYGRVAQLPPSPDTQANAQQPLADAIVIRDDAETILVELDVRALLIFL
jgi:hypothetical protein